MSVLPNLRYRSHAISIKISASYFKNIGKMTLRRVWRGKRSRIANTKLKEKPKVRGLTLPDFQTHDQATVVKLVWYWWRNRRIDQWNRTESPEIDPRKYSQLPSIAGRNANVAATLGGLTKLTIFFTIQSSNRTPWYLFKGAENYVYTKTRTWMTVAALFLIIETWT